MSKLKSIARRIRIDIKLSKTESWGGFWNYRHGFLKNTVEVCGITKENYKDFISDREYRLAHQINGAYSSIIDNKLWLPLLLNKFDKFIPTYFYLFSNGVAYDMVHNRVALIDEVLLLIRKKGRVACKHTHSSLGIGFLAISYEEDGYKINDNSVSESDLINTLGKLDQYILTEYVIQHEYSNKIAPNSLNTIRLQTVKSSFDRPAKIVRAFHRFGANGSVVDNLAAGCGGILSYVDPDKGVLKGVGVVNKGNTVQCVEDLSHPNSGVRLKGLQIPNYSFIKDTILEIVDQNPYLKYVGWDIAVTENSFKIIEANSLTTLSTIQQKSGFYLDEDLRKIFKK